MTFPGTCPRAFSRRDFAGGGREPILRPDVAVELSVWYQGQARFAAGDYGFADDRSIEPSAHQFWGRALVANSFTHTGHYLEVSLTAGAVLNADRLSAFRLGGMLPSAAEFPLMLPGHYFEELSAQRFLLADALLIQPVIGRWDLLGYGGHGIGGLYRRIRATRPLVQRCRRGLRRDFQQCGLAGHVGVGVGR